MYHVCAPESSFTHMKDVISEYIKDNVQQRKQKDISTLLHTSIDRHEDLKCFTDNLFEIFSTSSRTLTGALTGECS